MDLQFSDSFWSPVKHEGEGAVLSLILDPGTNSKIPHGGEKAVGVR